MAQQNQYDLTLPAVYYNIAAWMQGSYGHLLQSLGKAFYQIHSSKWYQLLDFFPNIKKKKLFVAFWSWVNEPLILPVEHYRVFLFCLNFQYCLTEVHLSSPAGLIIIPWAYPVYILFCAFAHSMGKTLTWLALPFFILETRSSRSGTNANISMKLSQLLHPSVIILSYD